MFESVVDQATPMYKARAIIALGSMDVACGDIRSAMPLYVKAACGVGRAREFDPLAAYYIQSSMAIVRSIDGNHNDALSDLEEMFPLARAVGMSYPALYYNHLNSFAVELLEAGRIIEAQNVSKIILASPYVGAYPEYRETSIDIALRARTASRSVVSFAQLDVPAQNILRLPPAEHVNSDTSVEPAPDRRKPARVFDIQKWKAKMGKEPNGDQVDNKRPQDMAQDEMLYRIIHLYTDEDMDEATRLEMLESVERVAAKKRTKKPDKDKDKDKDKD
jgi:hypothetical protein